MSERELFLRLVEIDDAEERVAQLNHLCPGQQELRQRLESLLAQHARDDSFFLDNPPDLVSATPLSPHTVETPVGEGATFEFKLHRSLQPGHQIGPYTIVELISEGGFGAVYIAEQQQPIRRRVALKVLKPGMNSAEILARFETERDVLALMDHPHVARVLDAGRTPENVPYFVMELVDGVFITDFCDREKLNIVERLGVFVEVCKAVQHAHQKGIIHRDIKPSNVLVSQHDGQPVPKVIDFGVAKALRQGLTSSSIYTVLGQFVGTPLYMSPEQAGGTGLDVDTRTDVYSLGVLLYELVSGTTPFHPETLRDMGFNELISIVSDAERPRPSVRLKTLDPNELSRVADRRNVDLRRMMLTLQGDLDWIVMKAIERDCDRRYGSPADLAEDVERFLAEQPVLAGPPSALYQTKKFIQRHKLWLTTSALVLLTMVVGTGFSVWHAIQADSARDQAQQAEELANERLELLLAEQTKLQEEQRKLEDEKQKLAISQAQSDRNFRLAKEAVAKLIDEVAQKQLIQYPELGEFRTTLLETAEQFYSRMLEESPGKIEILRSRAEIRQKLNRPDDALQDYLAIEEIDPNDLPVLLKLASQLGTTGVAENSALAMEKARRATELYPDNAGAWSLLSWSYAWIGDTQNAIPAMRRAAECPQSDADRAHRLGNLLAFEGRHAEAATEFYKAAELGSLDPVEDYKRSATNLLAIQRTDEAIERLSQAIALDKYRPEIYWRRAEAYLSTGNSEAAADLQQLLQLAPSASYALTALFDFYQKMNDETGAAELLNRRSGEIKADQNLLDEQRVAWIEQSENQQLRQAFEQFQARVEAVKKRDAISLARKKSQTALELLRSGERHQGLMLLREAIQIAPELSEGHLHLGMALRHIDEKSDQESIAELRTLIRLQADDPNAHAELARMLVSSRFPHLRHPDEAQTHVDHAIKLLQSAKLPETAQLVATQGIIQLRLGNYDQAIEFLNQALEMPDKSYCPVRLYLAMCHWGKGDRVQAKAYYDAAYAVVGPEPKSLNNRSALMQAQEMIGEILDTSGESPAAGASAATSR